MVARSRPHAIPITHPLNESLPTFDCIALMFFMWMLPLKIVRYPSTVIHHLARIGIDVLMVGRGATRHMGATA